MKLGMLFVLFIVAFSIAEGIWSLVFKTPYDFLHVFTAVWYSSIGACFARWWKEK